MPAGFMLRLIGQLYPLEAQWDEAGWPEPAQRAHLRRRDFASPLNLLRKAAAKLSARVLPRTRLGEACSYLLAQWQPLSAHLQHGATVNVRPSTS